jgi:hypothetical protein
MRFRTFFILLALAGLVFTGALVWNRFAFPENPVVAPAASSPPETVEVARPLETAPAPEPLPAEPPVVNVSTSSPPVVSWGQQREEILKSDSPVEEKAAQFLAMLPRLEGAEQEEAARHMINLLGDEQFPIASGYLTNAQAPAQVQELLMAELLNRPEKLKLPLYLAIMRTEGHPKAEEAREMLKLYITEDLRTNWPAWEEAVQARLQKTP